MRVPPSLAYGERGEPTRGIPGSATLIVSAELVDIAPAASDNFLIRRKKAGTGPVIRNGQAGHFHYTGVLAEGDDAGLQFDSSRMPDRPKFVTKVGPMGSVIEGWKKGLQGMRVGEIRWLKIPPELGYGSQDQGLIPPNSTLIFEVELMGIEPGAAGAVGGGVPRRASGSPRGIEIK
ncbi:MAG: FKBP-type peptidyl-prolyl cis-trans isomerase [Planctomycetes bacterium]|nr:FKBP-type peptidyl-prolyl cis-trans isomerase [Planctomycetota bacterium]